MIMRTWLGKNIDAFCYLLTASGHPRTWNPGGQAHKILAAHTSVGSHRPGLCSSSAVGLRFRLALGEAVNWDESKAELYINIIQL